MTENEKPRTTDWSYPGSASKRTQSPFGLRLPLHIYVFVVFDLHLPFFPSAHLILPEENTSARLLYIDVECRCVSVLCPTSRVDCGGNVCSGGGGLFFVCRAELVLLLDGFHRTVKQRPFQYQVTLRRCDSLRQRQRVEHPLLRYHRCAHVLVVWTCRVPQRCVKEAICPLPHDVR